MADLQDLLKQAEKLQSEMSNAQDKIAQTEILGQSGGGMVKVVMNGQNKVLRVQISPELCRKEDQEVLEDLIVAAVNDGITKVQDIMQKEMQDKMKGLNLPVNLPF